MFLQQSIITVMWSLCTVQWSLRTPMLSWKGLSLRISSSFTSRDMPVWSPLIRGHSNIIYWTHTAVRNLSIDSRLHSEEFYKYWSHTKRFNQYGLFMLRTSKGSLRGFHHYFFFKLQSEFNSLERLWIKSSAYIGKIYEIWWMQ